MKKALTLALALVVLSGLAWASHNEITGGFRNGLAFGLKYEETKFGSLALNYGLEATTGEDFSFTGDNPVILFGGVELPLFELGPRKMPTSLELGLVGYSGNQSQLGVYASVMVDNLNGIEPLDLEVGYDYFGDHGHVTLQLGYTLVSDLTSTH
ncbi:MAG: hypothetical protein WC632_00315 [Candidatus Margulisiibacteriota bacterium]